MNGIHDLGGMHGFGRVDAEDGAIGFRARWEGRVVGLFARLVPGGYFNIDAFRHGIETLDPNVYLSAAYFERWLLTISENLVRRGAVSREELAERVEALRGDPELARRVVPGSKPAPPAPEPLGFSFVRELEEPPRFAPGEAVRARNHHPPGHTRLPRYVRGRVGRVERVHAAFVFPDTNAHDRGEDPQHLYNVRFEGRELWGDSAEPTTAVHIDLFESYLEPHGAAT